MPHKKQDLIYSWLDGNATVYPTNEMRKQLAAIFDIKESTAKLYICKWRKSHGVQRRWTKRSRAGND